MSCKGGPWGVGAVRLGKCLICVGGHECAVLQWVLPSTRSCGNTQRAGPRRRQGPSVRCACEATQVLSGCVIRGMKSLPKKDIVPLSPASAKLYWRLLRVAKTNSAHQIFYVLPYNSQPMLQVGWGHVVEFWDKTPHLLPLFLLLFFCLLDPGHRCSRCLWAPPSLAGTHQYILKAAHSTPETFGPRQAGGASVSVPANDSWKLVINTPLSSLLGWDDSRARLPDLLTAVSGQLPTFCWLSSLSILPPLFLFWCFLGAAST